MKQRFELLLLLALAAACAVTYAMLISKVTQWTIWRPLEAYFTG
jgi:hypothetical protein